MTSQTRVVKLGSLNIGGSNKIAVQTMLTDGLCEPERCIEKINKLEAINCDAVRIAVRDEREIANVKNIKTRTSLPLIADIQFDINHAFLAIKSGFEGIRINPGYIKNFDQADKLIDLASSFGTCIRIGINCGSLSSMVKNLIFKGMDRKEAIIYHVKEWINYFENSNFFNYKVSLKSSSVEETICLNKMLSDITNAPIHLGVTEAGNLAISSVRSSIAFSKLLSMGIGDTIRVSITGDPEKEILVAREILRTIGLLEEGPIIISCPTCSRCVVSLERVTNEIVEKTSSIKKRVKIAIMGCAVNGPGEAKDADVGIAGLESGRFALFKKGVRIKNIDASCAVSEIIKEVMGEK